MYQLDHVHAEKAMLLSHAIQRRQHLIERDVYLHAVTECLKIEDILRLKQVNTHRYLQNILKLFSSRQREQRPRIIPTKSLRVTPQILFWRSSTWKCSMAVSDNDNNILVSSSEK